MKSLIKITLVILSLFVIAACGNNKPPKLEDRVNNQATVNTQATYKGVIESFGVDIYKDGTHKIKTNDGKTIVIQSPTINLTSYIDKKVTITGSMKKLIDNKSEVFTVTKIKTEGINSDGRTTEYKNQKLGFELKYADVWEITEESEIITFSSNGADWVSIYVFNNVDKTIDEFSKAKETGEGTAVTIAGQRSLRYIEKEKVVVYIPNTAKKNIYKITFVDKGDDKEEYKKLFYNLLDSLKLIATQSSSGKKCGGKEALTCPEDYRCELQGGQEDAEGVCVSVNNAKSDCPYVATPSGCTNYKATGFNKDNCPTSYTCLDQKNSTKSDTSTSATSTSQSSTTSSTTKDTSNTEDKKPDSKTTTNTSESEDNSNSSATENTSKEAKDTTSETEEEVVAPSAGMAAYSNTRRSFSMEYPKNWYYRAFGAIDGTIESMGFGGKELDTMADATISVKILTNSATGKKEMKGDRYIVTVGRNNKSHFVINGPLGMKDTIDKMAESIKLDQSE